MDGVRERDAVCEVVCDRVRVREGVFERDVVREGVWLCVCDLVGVRVGERDWLCVCEGVRVTELVAVCDGVFVRLPVLV